MAGDPTNSFDLGDIFGDPFGDPLGGIFGKVFAGPRQQPPQDPNIIRRQALLRDLRTGLAKNDVPYLEHAVEQWADDIRRDNNPELLRLHAKACIYVGQLELAAKSYMQARKISSQEAAVFGLIIYKAGNYSAAASHLSRIKQEKLVPQARLALSAILFAINDENPESHLRVLDPIVPVSADANEHIGIANFNNGLYAAAEAFFNRAVGLEPEEESHHLNLFRSCFRQGRESDVYAKMNVFFVHTGSHMTPETLETALRITRIPAPTYAVDKRSLFSILA